MTTTSTQPRQSPQQVSDVKCVIDGCDKPVAGRGWCWRHYARWQRTGDPLALPSRVAPGDQFGRLTAVEVVGKRGTNLTWRCLCTCGNSTIVRADHLRSGNTESCGCLRTERSGRRRHDPK